MSTSDYLLAIDIYRKRYGEESAVCPDIDRPAAAAAARSRGFHSLFLFLRCSRDGFTISRPGAATRTDLRVLLLPRSVNVCADSLKIKKKDMGKVHWKRTLGRRWLGYCTADVLIWSEYLVSWDKLLDERNRRDILSCLDVLYIN